MLAPFYSSVPVSRPAQQQDPEMLIINVSIHIGAFCAVKCQNISFENSTLPSLLRCISCMAFIYDRCYR